MKDLMARRLRSRNALCAALLLAISSCAAAPSAEPPSPSADADSAQCARCHNERCGHPMGADYAEKTGNDRLLALSVELNPAVKLVGGRIGCTTCHVPYNEYDHRMLAAKRKDKTAPDPTLVIDNSESALCMACHRK